MQLANEINPNTASTVGVDEHILKQYLLGNMYLSDGGQFVWGGEYVSLLR